MTIRTDEEGKKVIQELCDIALKNLGLNGFQKIGQILSSIEIITEDHFKPNTIPFIPTEKVSAKGIEKMKKK